MNRARKLYINLRGVTIYNNDIPDDVEYYDFLNIIYTKPIGNKDPEICIDPPSLIRTEKENTKFRKWLEKNNITIIQIGRIIKKILSG